MGWEPCTKNLQHMRLKDVLCRSRNDCYLKLEYLFHEVYDKQLLLSKIETCPEKVRVQAEVNDLNNNLYVLTMG